MHRWLGLCAAALTIAAAAMWNAGTVSGDEWLPVSQEELKLTSVPEAPGAPAVYLFRQVDRKDSARAASEFNYLRIKVLTEEGRKFGNIEIPIEKGRTSISGLHARTIQPDGTVTNFSGKVIDQVFEKTKGYKYVAKTFSIPGVQVGSIIEYRFYYDFEDLYLFSSEWILSEELFTKRAQFTLKPYEQFPWRVVWSWPAGLPAGSELPAQGAVDRVIRLTANNIPAFVTEDHMPPPNELKFRVNFVYHDDGGETDVVRYWRSFNKKRSGQIEGFMDRKKSMEQAASTIVSPADSPEAKLQKIYERVQKLQNTSYMPLKTADERKHEGTKDNGNVEDVWKRQYGSGDELNWLFLALARGAGFEAYPCLVSSRGEYFFHKERVNGRELNAAIALVKVSGRDEFLDPGSAFTPFGLLPWSETGVDGMKLDKDGGAWIQTTMPDSNETRIERSAKLQISAEGDVNGQVTVRYVGLTALSLRSTLRNEDEASRKKILEDDLKESIPAGSEVELTNKPDFASSGTPLIAEYDVKVPGWTAPAGKRALLPTGLFTSSEKHLFEHTERVWPVYFRYPYRKIDDLVFSMPAGWKIETMPQDMDRNAKAVEYSLKVENKEGSVHVQRMLRSDVVMVARSDYAILRNFYQIVRSEDEKQVVLQPSGTSAAK